MSRSPVPLLFLENQKAKVIWDDVWRISGVRGSLSPVMLQFQINLPGVMTRRVIQVDYKINGGFLSASRSFLPRQ
jgi:ribosomal protein L35AE/L33A